jgi:hypothetical protein
MHLHHILFNQDELIDLDKIIESLKEEKNEEEIEEENLKDFL